METSKLVSSNSQDENYLAYLFIEMVLVFVITVVIIGLIVFYSTGSSDVRLDSNHLGLLTDNPLLFGVICTIPAIIAVGVVVFFRNRNYIVGYFFNDESNLLFISYRGLINKKIKTVEIPYSKLSSKDFKEVKFLFNEANRGKRLKLKNPDLHLDFVSNNFIWEKQPREKVHFLHELHRVEGMK